MADMTLYAPQGLQIVTMERFEPLTSSVECNADDHTMSLTFKSKEAYDHALKKWSFINENKDDKFLLIANHAGCGPEDQRQPYLVSSVDDVAEQRKVFLSVTETSWSEVAGTYDLAFGKELPKAPTAAGRRLKPRLSWDDVKEGLEDAYQATEDAVQEVGSGIADAAQGNADLAKSISFGIPIGSSGKETEIYNKGPFTLSCVDCYVKGSFKVTGHVKVANWKLNDLSLDTSPQGFEAMMMLEATLKASKSPAKLNPKPKTLFSGPIPSAGINVPEIFKLGATWSYGVGFRAEFSGEGVVDFGLSATIPDSAKAVINLAGAGQSSATGWKGDLTPHFQVKSLSADIKLTAYSAPKLMFGVELNKVGKAAIALDIHAPEVSSKLTVSYQSEGVCKDDPKKTVTGVDWANEAKLSVTAEVNVEFLEDTKLEPWSNELWSSPTLELPGKCQPIDIPGLIDRVSGGGGDADTKPAPAPSGGNTCTVSGKSGTCVSTSSCSSSGGKATPGHCPGLPNDIQCCVPPDSTTPSETPKTCKVGSLSGTCQSTSSCSSSGGKSTAGHCSGLPDDIQCCTTPEESTPKESAPESPKTCKVGSTSGQCQSTSSCSSTGGKSTPGHCPGLPNDIQVSSTPNTLYLSPCSALLTKE